MYTLLNGFLHFLRPTILFVLLYTDKFSTVTNSPCSKTDFSLLCSLMKFHIFHPRNVGLYCEGDPRSKVILCLRAFTAVNIELR